MLAHHLAMAIAKDNLKIIMSLRDLKRSDVKIVTTILTVLSGYTPI